MTECLFTNEAVVGSIPVAIHMSVVGYCLNVSIQFNTQIIFLINDTRKDLYNFKKKTQKCMK